MRVKNCRRQKDNIHLRKIESLYSIIMALSFALIVSWIFNLIK